MIDENTPPSAPPARFILSVTEDATIVAADDRTHAHRLLGRDPVGCSLLDLLIPPDPLDAKDLWIRLRDGLAAPNHTLAFVEAGHGVLRPVQIVTDGHDWSSGLGAVRIIVNVLVPMSPKANVDQIGALATFQSPDLFITLDENFRIVFANPAIEQLFGVAAGGMCGRRVDQVGLPPAIGAMFERDPSRSPSDQVRSFEFALSLGGVDRVYMASSIVLDRPGDSPLVGVYCRDITEAADRIGRLETRVATLQAVLRGRENDQTSNTDAGRIGPAPVPRAVIDARHTVLEVSASLCRMLNQPRVELIGRPLSSLFAPATEDGLFGLSERLWKGETDYMLALGKLTPTDGQPIVVRGRFMAHRDHGHDCVEVDFLPVDRVSVLEDDPSYELTFLRTRLAQAERVLMQAYGAIGEVMPQVAASASAPGPLPEAITAPLTERELEIVHLVAQGMRPPSIGRELFLSASTVRNHLSKIFRKLGVSSQEELVKVIRQGLR